MALEVNKPYLVLRTGMKDGKLVALVMDGDCDEGLLNNKPHLSLRTGTKDGKQVQLVADQRLAGDGNLIVNKPYLALRTGMKDGKVVVLVAGKQCSGFTFCECEICCTLEATVEVGDTGNIYAWSDPVDVNLTCGSFFQTHGGYYCLEEISLEDQFALKITTTWDEKDTVGSPEAYDLGTSSGTRECFTKIWSSGNFDIDGETYRLTYWHTEATTYQTSPSVVTTTGCTDGYFLQHMTSDPDYGDFWELVVEGGTSGYPLDQPDLHWLFNRSDDNPYAPDDCPEGYIFNGGDLNPGNMCRGEGNASYTAGGSTDSEACPVYEAIEKWYRLTADPDDDAHREKCARITIADNCEPA